MYSTQDSFSYTTVDIDPGKAFEFYQSSVTKHFVPAECKAYNRDIFHGEVNGHQCGQLLAGRYAATDHVWDRSDQLVRTKPDDDFVALLLDSGSSKMSQVGRHLEMNPGDIILFDAAKSFTHDIASGSVILVRIPRTLMKAHLAHAEKYVNIKIGDGLSIRPLISGLMREVYKLSPTVSQEAGVKLANALLSTLSAALEMHATGVIESYDSRSLFDKALSIIDLHIDDPDMNVEKIASLLHVSERTLSRVFARRGVLPSKALSSRRLEKSYHMLKGHAGSQVSQVAYACGFNDLAHFSRSFKKMYGLPPSKLCMSAQ